jgi:hypothetical protein
MLHLRNSWVEPERMSEEAGSELAAEGWAVAGTGEAEDSAGAGTGVGG